MQKLIEKLYQELFVLKYAMGCHGLVNELAECSCSSLKFIYLRSLNLPATIGENVRIIQLHD